MSFLVLPPYVQGMFYSLVFLLAIGPSFFYLISLSIIKGFKSGAFFAVGIVLSDIIIMAIIYFGFGDLFDTHEFKFVFNGIGGTILVFLGVKFLLDKKIEHQEDKELKISSGGFRNLSKGFIVNLGNPFAYLAWLTVRTSVANTHPDFKQIDFLLFFAGLFGSIVLFEILKAFLANRIGKFLTSTTIYRIHKLLGLIFVCVGVWLLYQMVQGIENIIH